MKEAPIPKKRELFFLRVIILLVLGYGVYFVQWFFNRNIIDNYLLFSLIAITLIYRIMRLLHQWVHLFFLPTKRVKSKLTRNLTVDVFTTFCPGEPYEMVEETLLAIKNIQHPHGTFLCAEGHDSRLEAFCTQHDIRFVFRNERINAKAGNVNNALQYSTADICVILDPDHIPEDNFITIVLPAFEEDSVGFVQVPQIYYNHSSSFVAKGAAQQTYEFYGPLMNASNAFGTTPAIGANCTFRRAALDAIGGHAAGLTEDMHTSMLLHAEGWKSVFIPTPVSKGLVPANLSSYYKQQLKWSRGSFDLFFKVMPRIFSKLTWNQRMHYLSVPLYFLFGLIILIDFSIPVMSLLSGNYPLKCRMDDLAVILAPFVLGAMFIKLYTQRWYYDVHEKGIHFFGEALRLSTWWINLVGFVYAIVGVKVPYMPTPKEENVENEYIISIPNILVIGLITVAISVGLYRDYSDSSILMASYVAVFGVVMFSAVFFGFGKTLQRPLWKKSIEGIGAVAQSVMRKTAFIGVLVSIAAWMLFFDYYRNLSHPLKDFIPPKFKNVGGVYIASNAANANVVYYEDEVPYDVDTTKFVYLRLNWTPRDSLAVVNRVDAICRSYLYASGSAYFVDFMGIADGISPRDYKHLWKIASDRFLINQKNPIKVFRYRDVEEISRYIPDTRYVDWLCLQVDSSAMDFNYTINALYNEVLRAKLPMFIDITSKKEVFADALHSSIQHNDYKEIRGVIASRFKSDQLPIAAFQPLQIEKKKVMNTTCELTGIRGVHYNVSQDWKDDFQTLTTKSISKDIGRIKEMGANTILRFGPTRGDRNILSVAEEQDISVLYGFTIPPRTDFTDEEAVRELKNEMLDVFDKHKESNNIVGWCLGNGVLQELRNYYGEPYLSIQQKYYLNMVNELIVEMTSKDLRPVTIHTALDKRTQVDMNQIKKYAPHLTHIGLALHYSDNISFFNPIADQYKHTHCFYFTSVGIDNYVDKNYPNRKDYYDLDSTVVEAQLMELTEKEKCDVLAQMWKQLTVFPSGGIMLNSYTDKMSGTFTWNGLTDYKGRKKPLYYQIKKMWKEDTSALNVPLVMIEHPYTYVEEDSVYRFIANLSLAPEYTTMEWMLCKSDIIPLEDAILNQQGNTVTVRIPNDPKNGTTYRLFLFASNGENVTTCSYFLPLRWYYK